MARDALFASAGSQPRNRRSAVQASRSIPSSPRVRQQQARGQLAPAAGPAVELALPSQVVLGRWRCPLATTLQETLLRARRCGKSGHRMLDGTEARHAAG